ncbi:PepSY-associated TM helix domain-containing protein [Nocardiopsis sediminis]|uniref:PepSY-associated TM helix domain-containing protein n=1 Tax=Nocardiopsis sediminis TaxID=1778267 RepID=A0ABV8FQH2_9ACTN
MTPDEHTARLPQPPTGGAADPSASPPAPPDGAADLSASSSDSPTAQRRSAWSLLRPGLLRLHFYAGILVAPFILVAAVTGLLYVYTPQLEQALYADVLRVPVGDGQVALGEQVAAATEAHPEGTLSAVRPAAGPGESTRVLLDVPGLAESHRLGVFVDPYTGEVLGALDSYGSSAALPVRSWISELHRNLHLGEAGRVYSELAASWMWVVALGGAALWISRTRAKRGARTLLTPEPGATGRRRTMSWHGSVGLWIVVVVVAISATGLSWSRFAGANIEALRAQLNWHTPAVSAYPLASYGDGTDDTGGSGDSGHSGHGDSARAPAADGPDHDEGGGHGEEGGAGEASDGEGAGETESGHGGGHGEEDDLIVDGVDVGVDRVLAVARDAGLEGGVEIVYPPVEGASHTVQETGARWPTQHDAVAVHAPSGVVTDEVRFADYPFMAKMTRWGIDAHMGLLFGLPNQLFLTAVAIGLITVIVLGYRMWWQRRPSAATGFAMGRPFPRGAWSALPWRIRLPVIAVAVAIGYFFPLFGASLLMFLILDLILTARHLRREADADAPHPDRAS